MTKELRKEIYTKSRLKIKYKRSPTEENKAICKKRNKYIYLYQKAIKLYFSNVMKTGVQSIEDFWNSTISYFQSVPWNRRNYVS